MSEQIVWAHARVPEVYAQLNEQLTKTRGYQPHWSRLFEYPWVLLHGDFQQGQKVLDAGGGNGPLQYYLAELGCCVTNVDEAHEADRHFQNVVQLKYKLEYYGNLGLGCYDRVVCISVLEHTTDPGSLVKMLYHCLKPGGRLIVTLDVAGYARRNHAIDNQGAQGLFSYYGTNLPLARLKLPPEPDDILSARFQEIDASRWEPDCVWLRVLCFYVDKPEEKS